MLTVSQALIARMLANPARCVAQARVESGYAVVSNMDANDFQVSGRTRRLAFPAIATHNHFVFDQRGDACSTAMHKCIKLAALRIDRLCTSCLAAILNSSRCLFLPQAMCFNKGAGDDPVRDRYDIARNYCRADYRCPEITLPRRTNRRRHLLSEEMVGLQTAVHPWSCSKLFEKDGEAYHAWNSALDGYMPPHSKLPPPFDTARELRAARKQLIALRQDIRGRMIFLQEEMDWLAYEMYGLIKKAPLAEDYLSPVAVSGCPAGAGPAPLRAGRQRLHRRLAPRLPARAPARVPAPPGRRAHCAHPRQPGHRAAGRPALQAPLGPARLRRRVP